MSKTPYGKKKSYNIISKTMYHKHQHNKKEKYLPIMHNYLLFYL